MGDAQVWALVSIAFAILAGCGKIADAIRYRTVDVRFKDPIQIVHQRPDDGPR